MDRILTFRPGLQTAIVSATTSAGAATLMGSGVSGDVDYLVYNKGLADAYLAYGTNSTIAQANAVIPLIGGPSSVLPCPAGTLQVFTLTGNLFFSAIAEVGMSSITITPGMGA